nr:hypothetical protein [Rhizobium laguerreae]
MDIAFGEMFAAVLAFQRDDATATLSEKFSYSISDATIRTCYKSVTFNCH